MKLQRFGLVLLVVCWLGQPAWAKISKSEFKSSERLTAGQLFMNQVDIVSLYLSTDHVIYVPRLTPDRTVRITITFLGMNFGGDEKGLQDFATRHINTFNSTLQERLAYYTPELAKEFKPEEDLEFIIQVGEERKVVGAWTKGAWVWTSEKGVEEVQKVLSEESKSTCRRKCPALIQKKEVKEAPKEDVQKVDEVPPAPK